MKKKTRRTKAEIAADAKIARQAEKEDSAAGPVVVHPTDVKLCDLAAGRGDRLVVSHRIYNGKHFIDVRRWYKDRRTQTYMPTKGCSVGGNPDVLRSLAKAIVRGAEVMELEAAQDPARVKDD